MTLKEALIKQGNDISTVYDIIEEMKNDVIDGYSPEDVLLEYGLDADYVFDLLIICKRYTL